MDEIREAGESERTAALGAQAAGTAEEIVVGGDAPPDQPEAESDAGRPLQIGRL